ncbi:unnamed protein product [Phytophthora fragariaefolia]|uniref:Unnamed protein product n=1 Tax=Phytophthora fragariaefolia TaxID=1490495 RepID=A0A9W6UBA8_9STRA|nr:unnamed protein product [Phytophthora fragariaefolia]
MLRTRHLPVDANMSTGSPNAAATHVARDVCPHLAGPEWEALSSECQQSLERQRTYGVFKEELRQAFEPPQNKFRSKAEFLDLQQGKHDVHAYAQRVRYLVSIVVANPIDEATKVVMFMKSLRDGPMKTYLFREYPSTLEAAITLATQEGFSLRQAKLHANVPRPIPRPAMKPTGGPEPMVLSRATAAGSQQRLGSMNVRCLWCENNGQYARECAAPVHATKGRRDDTGLAFEEVEQPRSLLEVRLATGVVVRTEKHVVRARFSYEEQKLVDELIVLDLDDKIDMVLGMRWLARHDLPIDWEKRTIVRFRSSGATESDGPVGAAHAPRGACDPPAEAAQCAAASDLSARTLTTEGVVREKSEPNQKTQIRSGRAEAARHWGADALSDKSKKERFDYQGWHSLKLGPLYEVLREYKDVLPDDIPAELPQDKGVQHEIDLVPETKSGYASDADAKQLLNSLAAPFDKSRQNLAKHLRACVHRYRVHNGLLLYSAVDDNADRVVVPDDPELNLRITYECHDAPTSGHPGREKTYLLLTRDFYWSHQYKLVQKYVRACEVYQRVNPAPFSQAPLRLVPTPSECWQSISMDFVFGLPPDNKRWTGIVTLVDRSSKMVHLAAVPAKVRAKRTARLFADMVFRRRGMSIDIVSDRVPCIRARFLRTSIRLPSGITQLSMSTAPLQLRSTDRSRTQTTMAEATLMDLKMVH